MYIAVSADSSARATSILPSTFSVVKMLIGIPLRVLRGRQLLCDLPAVAVGVGEGRGAHAPDAVDRAGEEGDAALLEERTDGVDVVDPDAELEPGSCLAVGYRRRLDLLSGGGGVQEVDEEVVELHADGGRVLEDDVHVEDVAVEGLRCLQIVDEETDRADFLEGLRGRLRGLNRRRVLIELRQVVGDLKPGGLRADEDVLVGRSVGGSTSVPSATCT